jgi:hypothetical protein
MWSSGEPAVLRYVRYGQVRRASPHIVVRDDADLVALYIPVGTLGRNAVWDGSPIRGQADRDWALRDHVWDTYDVLRLIRFGQSHSLELFRHAESGAFAGWYVNLQEPLRRSPVGFDTDDLVLDIWIDPDGTWKWKDEDELEAAVRLGRLTPAEAAAVREEGERVIEMRPWPTGWEDWRPDPRWEPPRLPAGWDVVD